MAGDRNGRYGRETRVDGAKSAGGATGEDRDTGADRGIGAGKVGGKNISGFTIAGKILFANCAVVAAGAFTGAWVTQHFSDQPSFVLGTILFSGGLLVSLPVN